MSYVCIFQLCDHLLMKEWPQDKLSQLFRTTETLEKALEILGDTVNKASRFAIEMDEIEREHCRFKVSDDFKVSVEFLSTQLFLNFALEIDYSQGFKAAKSSGVKVTPIIDQYGKTISQGSLDVFVKASSSGWGFLKGLVSKIDVYVKELQFLRPPNNEQD